MERVPHILNDCVWIILCFQWLLLLMKAVVSRSYLLLGTIFWWLSRLFSEMTALAPSGSVCVEGWEDCVVGFADCLDGEEGLWRIDLRVDGPFEIIHRRRKRLSRSTQLETPGAQHSTLPWPFFHTAQFSSAAIQVSVRENGAPWRYGIWICIAV